MSSVRRHPTLRDWISFRPQRRTRARDATLCRRELRIPRVGTVDKEWQHFVACKTWSGLRYGASVRSLDHQSLTTRRVLFLLGPGNRSIPVAFEFTAEKKIKCWELNKHTGGLLGHEDLSEIIRWQYAYANHPDFGLVVSGWFAIAGATNSVDNFVTATSPVHQLALMPTSRHSHAMCCIDGGRKLFIAGGYGSSDCWVYDITESSWAAHAQPTDVNNLWYTACGVAVTSTGDEEVVLAGGICLDSTSSSVHIFNTKTRSWRRGNLRTKFAKTGSLVRTFPFHRRLTSRGIAQCRHSAVWPIIIPPRGWCFRSRCRLNDRRS